MSIKDTLREIKDHACDVRDLVGNQAGPLTDPQDKATVEAEITSAADEVTGLLNDASGTMHTPPSTWLHWMPIDTSGMDLSDAAKSACDEACRAYDEYCANTPPTSANIEAACNASWLQLGVYCAIFETAGI